MTSSRSKISISNVVIALALLVGLGTANAGGRKRIVVLDFDGPKAEKFHDDLVKMIKKNHTVISTEKWNGAADELDASKVTEKNVKKVAKKLKIDGIITGKIEKRRDEYIVQLKLRAGSSGELVGNRIDTKAEGPRIDGKAARDIKDELIGAIEDLEANHGGGSDDDADDTAKPTKKKKPADDDADDDAKPAKHGAFSKKKLNDDDDDDAKPVKKSAKKAADDDDDAKPTKKVAKKAADDDDDAKPAKKSAKKATDDDDDAKPARRPKKATDDDDDGHKKVAKTDDDDDGSVEAHADEPALPADALSPANRAVDFVIGMSFTARRLSFSYDADLVNAPPAYKQSVPVAGGIMDVTIYPLAFTHTEKGPLAGLGVEVMYDKVIHISSSKNYVDSTTMTQMTATLPTVEDRFTIGAVYRYPLGAAVIGGKLMYSSQQFTVLQTLPNAMATDIPNVDYSAIEPKVFVKYTINPKMIFDADAGFMLITGAGAITQESTSGGYGAATATGYELAAGLDYALTKNIFVRGEARFESIGLSFKGDPNSLANNRDSDPDQDVHSATDVYFGAIGTIGYIY